MKISLNELRKLIRETMEMKKAKNFPDTLYHATSSRNVPLILQNGLIPYNNWDTPVPAIFFMDSLREALDMYDIIGHAGQSEAFIVHVNKLPTGTVFYHDLDAGDGAYWTPDRIPVTALEQVVFED